jgi:ubiquinone biosynthesis protein
MSDEQTRKRTSMRDGQSSQDWGAFSDQERADASVVQAMPRRERVASDETRSFGHNFKVGQSQGRSRGAKVSLFRALGRLFVWTRYLALLLIRVMLLKITRRENSARRATLLRETLEKMGPTAIKVGQQLSVRADILPYEYCRELSKMLDTVPPFKFSQAVELIEGNLGCPLNEVFATIDPKPIGSASLSCVFQAVLHTGEKVAVKVKRPGIDNIVTSDLKAVCWLCIVSEWSGLVRPGLTRNFREELTRMLTEELDFVLEARYTEIFRNESKKNKYISAPNVYMGLCGENVIVTEFIAGVFLIEILTALDQDNFAALENFRQRGYDLVKLSKRMMRVFHWEVYETHFFHADPHPANLIVKPNNTLVMIDFGSCGSVSSTMKRKFMQFNRDMVRGDVNGMAQTTISIFEPLPAIDPDSFNHALANIYRSLLIANECSNATWEEKCAGGMWMSVIGVCRDFNIPMNLDTIRIFRATFMYDSMIYRLNPKLDPRDEYVRYEQRYNRLCRDRVVKSLFRRGGGPLTADFARLIENVALSERIVTRVQKFIDTPSYTFGYSVNKVAYFFSTMTKAAIRMVQVLVLVTLVAIAGTYFTTPGEADAIVSFGDVLMQVVTDPVFIAIGLLYLLQTLHKVMFRIDDIDTN